MKKSKVSVGAINYSSLPPPLVLPPLWFCLSIKLHAEQNGHGKMQKKRVITMTELRVFLFIRMRLSGSVTLQRTIPTNTSLFWALRISGL